MSVWARLRRRGGAPDHGPGDERPDRGQADAGHGDAGHGDAGHGDAGHGDAGHGDAGHGDAGHGDAGHGDAGRDDGSGAQAAEQERAAGRSSEQPGAQEGDADLPVEAVAENAVLDELSLVFGDEADQRLDSEHDTGHDTGHDTASDPAGDTPDHAPPGETSGPASGAPPTDAGRPAGRVISISEPGLGDPHEADHVAGEPEVVDRPALIDPGLASVAPQAPPESSTDGPVHTIQIGDDDLPDTRYLDEELGSADGEGPVVIDDDDTDDAIVASEAAGRGIDGRIRQRRIRVRRAEGRRRLQWVLIGAGVIVAAIAVVAVLASSLFSVSSVTVVGNRYTDPEALKAVIVDLDGTPVLLVDTSAIEEDLEAIPWVESARVRTSFPDSASIDIRERTPVAAMPGADGLTRVLDKEGRVLDLIEGQPIALVWISGPVTLDIPAGHFASPGPTWASALVPKLTPSVRPRVESMQVTPDGSDLRLYLRPLSPAPSGGTDGDAESSAGESSAAESSDAESSDAEPALLDGPLIEVRFGSAIGDNEQIDKLVRLERFLDDIGTKRVTVIDVSTAEVTVL